MRAVTVVVILLLSSTGISAKENSRRVCKCLPGDSCYPDAATWAKFSANLSHPLIANQKPIASVCYANSSNFNLSGCATATSLQNDPVHLASSSNAVQYVNFEAILNGTSLQGCPYDTSGGAVCHQGRVPPNAVNASTVADIQKAVRFASQFNLKLVVRNTGHDLMGRSFGVGALEIFTHNLKGMQFFDKFVPQGALPATAGQYAVTMGAGVSWAEAYSAADQHNRSLPGGLSPFGTVGAAGGWLLGGGHSALSRYFGLGVDNALQFTVVLPNATFVTANQYQNRDLFWALRGGGGPTFGVVVSATVKTHPNPPYTAFFYIATGNSTAAYIDVLEVWNRFHNQLSDAGWSGVWPFFNNTLFFTFVAQGTPATHTANTTMESFVAASRAVKGINVSLALSVPYRSFEAFNLDNLVNPTRDYGFNFSSAAAGSPHSVSSSWLLPRNLTSPGNARMLAEIYANLTGGMAYMVGGGPVASADPSTVPLTPAWRTSISDLVLLPTGPGLPPVTNANVLTLRQTLFNQMQTFRKLAPPPIGGQYLNEVDYLEENWQEAFWGPNYSRLLSIKKAIDPHDLLIVRKGVNSENWDDEIICKTVPPGQG